MVDTPTPAPDAVEHTPERNRPMPIPKGGLKNNEQDAAWLADTLEMRLAETLKNAGFGAINIPTVGLYDLLLISLNAASKRAIAGVSTADIDAGAVQKLVEAADRAAKDLPYYVNNREGLVLIHALRAALAKFTTMKGE